MKFFLQSPDGQDRVDGTNLHSLINYLPGRVGSIASADFVLVPVSYFADFSFNRQLRSIGRKPYVIVDFLEYSTGWEGRDTHLLGQNLDAALFLRDSQEWKALDEWVSGQPPDIYFKREILEKDRSERVLPIEFCVTQVAPIQSRAEFDARPYLTFHSWGYSSAQRPTLHADTFRGMASKGLNVLSHWDQEDGHVPGAPNWVTIYSPWYNRKPMAEVMRWQLRSKISISMDGAGRKCFRHGEACVGSVMAMPNHPMSWSFPWEHGVNCVRLCPDHLFDDLDEATRRGDLYDLYLAGQETAEKYRQPYYGAHIMGEIERVI